MRITLTGIDAKTDLGRLPEYCELGFLYTYDPEGRPRYPEHHVLSQMMDHLKDRFLALHICGSRARKQLLDMDISQVRYANRIQVNGVISKEEAEYICDIYDNHQIIFQYHEKNKHLLDLDKENVQFLMDSSGGQGISPKEWVPPETFHPVGFAGGIGPDNIEETYCKVLPVSNCDTWLDMENKLRTDDWFDVDKANLVMQRFDLMHNSTHVVLQTKLEYFLRSEDKEDRIIAIKYSPNSEMILALSGDGYWFNFPKYVLADNSYMGKPDFSNIRIIDGGHTVLCGENYGVSAEGLRYDFDPEYRKLKDNG